MARLQLPVALVLLSALAACQASPTPPVTPASPSAAPSAAATPSASASAGTPTPSQAPVTTRVLMTGKIYDDKGGLLEGARLEVTSSNMPELNQTVEALGGAYAIANVPEGALLRLRAVKAGYTVREQVVKAEAVSYGADFNPNIRDFGGDGNGMLFALSEFPEIASVEPANRSTGATSNPLVIKFTLSHPLPSKDRLRFESLLQIRIPGPNGEQIIRPGTGYRDQPATVTWDSAGLVGTFTFSAPLVTYNSEKPIITVGFDQTRPIDEWPENDEGHVLGLGKAPKTAEGTGAEVADKIAPFLRNEFPTRPSTRPDQLGLWGYAHATTVSFNLTPNQTRPRVKEVRGIQGKNGANDRIVVTFDKPMRGYPESAPGVINYHESVLRASNYRYFLGNTDRNDDRERFEQGDPKTQGTPPDAPEFGSNSDTIVILPLSPGALSTSTVLKVFVDEAVKDITGSPIQASPQDPVTHLSDNVVQGVIQ